jgi:Zn-dependent protease with chaperone function
MIQFEGVYYDGTVSARKPVRVLGARGHLHVVGADINLDVPLAQVTTAPPVGTIRRMLMLPDGGQLVTTDLASIAALFPSHTPLERTIHRLEQNWQYALAALAVMSAFTWWALLSGVPAVAHFVAAFVPQAVETTLGAQTLAAIDRSVCKRTKLPAQRQREITKNFETLTHGLGDGYHYALKLRNCPTVGPNAFALPGGDIVLTDEMVALAQNDAQISAVLAHEIGHVRHRHALRLALQSAGAAALTAAIAGDAVSITGLAVTLPTILLQSGYSRTLEEEADTYAFLRLKQVGLSPSNFADIMTLMEEHHKAKEAERSAGKGENSAVTRLSDYLSTHPVTAERIQRARDAQ